MNHLNFGVLFFYCIDATERWYLLSCRHLLESYISLDWSRCLPNSWPGLESSCKTQANNLSRSRRADDNCDNPSPPNVLTTKPIQKHTLQPVKTISRYLEIRAAFYTTSHNLTFIFPVSGSHLRSAFQPPSPQLKFGHLGPVCGPLPTTSVLP